MTHLTLICGLCGQPLSACRCWEKAERRGTLVNLGLLVVFTVVLATATFLFVYAVLDWRSP